MAVSGAPLEIDVLQQRGADFLDRLGGGVEPGNAFAAHQLLRLFDFPAAVLQRGIGAVRPPFLADRRQPFRTDGQAEEFLLMQGESFGQFVAFEVLGNQRVIGDLDAVLDR